MLKKKVLLYQVDLMYGKESNEVPNGNLYCSFKV